MAKFKHIRLWQSSLLKIYMLMLIAILLLAIVGFPDAFHQQIIRLDRCLIILAAITAGLGLVKLKQWLQIQTRHTVLCFTWIVVIISVSLQIWLSWHILGDNIYDGMDTRFQAVNLLSGSRQWIPYFHDLAENNVPMTLIEFWLLAGFKYLHLNYWIGLNCFLFFWTDLTIGLMWSWLRQHFNLAIAGIGLLLAALYFPFYGYALFFYTDGLAVLFPILTLWLLDRYFTAKHLGQRYLLVVALGLELWLGFWIKGNNAILLIALLLVMIIEHKFGWRQTILSIIVITAIFTGSQMLSKPIEKAYGYQEPVAKKMPLLTWTMIGWNDKTQGSSSHTDTAMIQQQATYKQKQQLAIQQIKQRIKSLGLKGTIYYLIHKFNLMWSHGDLDATETLNQAQTYPKIFQYLYGSRKALLSSWDQMIYLILLASNLFFSYSLIKKRVHIDPTLSFSYLAILGIAVFHLIFWEAEARYVYTILPLLLLLASSGIASTNLSLNKKLRTRSFIWWNTGLVSSIVLGLAIIGFLNSKWITRPRSQQAPVLLQTKDYGIWQLNEKKRLVETFSLNKIANKIVWYDPNMATQQKLSVNLQRDSDKKLLPLKQQANKYTWKRLGTLKTGTYHLIIRNVGSSTATITILQSWHYSALPQLKSFTKTPKQKHYLLLSVVKQTKSALLTWQMLLTLVLLLVSIDLIALFGWFKKSLSKLAKNNS
ncbi:hypothetical protein DSM07_04350 [Oenococcus sp. UCMA 16435]|nr:hypothetical protein DSM07_04350 [Oenococcus sp. UCMA 16435]MDI4583776.1 hypothetical protein [Oenococcus sp. UCMA 14587]